MAKRRTLIGVISASFVVLGLIAAITVTAYSPRCSSYEHYGVRYCSQLVWGGSNYWQEPLSTEGWNPVTGHRGYLDR